eukprot:CAMPEP_0202689928 /NCGR_PEP_ID=MMETSP1385-20130828/5094_1 /ASSEMBLY_ACC=CAM_ASM_000861 /TAXON_ID=933848 /ORGANISM="Elphidium margaritaceum" /LENGTH=1059 /DNA_ID=CAMNT_0049345147 /DNA_START=134 /DNA_END=3313 /DNA_ORIENTATION=+
MDKVHKIRLGICCMDKKLKSDRHKNIMSRIAAYGDIEIIPFGDANILHRPIEEWPRCDVLIAYFSKGYPAHKVLTYVDKYRPCLINDLRAQMRLLRDRLSIKAILIAHNIPTPRYAVLNRDDPQHSVAEYDDKIVVNGTTIRKPFVEKPLNAEDHNVYVYYKGGGSRRLFRKVGNRSSEPSSCSCVRRTGNFIYEALIPSTTDIKVYTVGDCYVHAETRKAPTVDGIVERDVFHKEVRHKCRLTKYEKKIAHDIASAFDQQVCGFDIVRSREGRPFVIDVNGWSFVKSDRKYFDDCAQRLRAMCLQFDMSTLSPQRYDIARNVAINRAQHIVNATTNAFVDTEKMHICRGLFGIFRHGDRTPKQKYKCSTHNQNVISLISETKKLKLTWTYLNDSHKISEFAKIARQLYVETKKNKWLRIAEIASMKLISTKMQFKACEVDEHGRPTLALCILKWGGELTPAGTKQCKQFAPKFRNLLLQTSTEKQQRFLQHMKVFMTDEIRVRKTAREFTKTLLNAQKSKQLYQKQKKKIIAYKQSQNQNGYDGGVNGGTHHDHVYGNGSKAAAATAMVVVDNDEYTSDETNVDDSQDGGKLMSDTDDDMVLAAAAAEEGGGGGAGAGAGGDRDDNSHGVDEYLYDGKEVQHMLDDISAVKWLINKAKQEIQHIFYNDQLRESLLDDHYLPPTPPPPVSANAPDHDDAQEQEQEQEEMLDSTFSLSVSDINNINGNGNGNSNNNNKASLPSLTDPESGHAAASDDTIVLYPDSEKNEEWPSHHMSSPNYKLLPWSQRQLKQLENPVEKCEELYDILLGVQRVLQENMDTETGKQPYLDESPLVMKQRWDKIIEELYDRDKQKFDCSKIPDVFDSCRYDLLHNRHILRKLPLARLWLLTELLASFVMPQEYGLSREMKLQVSRGACRPLFDDIAANIKQHCLTNDNTSRTFLYFTSESYLHSLRNALILSDIPANKYVAADIEGMECSYFSHGVIRVYEDPECHPNSPNRFYVRIGFSPGAHANPLVDVERQVASVEVPGPLNGRFPLDKFLKFLSEHPPKTIKKDGSV